MIKIKNCIYIVALLAQVTYANPVGLKGRCPRIEDLWVSETSNFFHAEDSSVWKVDQTAQFGTQQQWTFYLGGFHVSNVTEAAHEAQKVIQTLVLENAEPARVYPTADPLWACFYDGKDLVAWAQTSDFAR